MPSKNLEDAQTGFEEYVPDLVPDLERVAKEEDVVKDSQRSVPLNIVWGNVLWFGFLHLGALYGLYLLPWALPMDWLWALALYQMGMLGTTAGAHRLWAHRSYKAKLPLRVLLGIFQTLAFQNDIIEWARDHRVHHKYSETHADPHNAKRGFFFSHCGWLFVRKLPDVKEKGKQIDMSDLYADPVCTTQRKYYRPGVFLLCFVFPALVPWCLWGESLWNAFFVCSMLRYMLCLHATFLVNSAAHLWGNHPYDQTINPAENIFVTWNTMGEGFHNYHHTFPHDYSTSEFGFKLNLTTLFIDVMAKLGQVTSRKSVPKELIQRRKDRTGDGSNGGFGILSSEGKKQL